MAKGTAEISPEVTKDPTSQTGYWLSNIRDKGCEESTGRGPQLSGEPTYRLIRSRLLADEPFQAGGSYIRGGCQKITIRGS